MAVTDPNAPFHFGDWLKFYFAERGVEIVRAAEQLGVSESTLHRWFGQRRPKIRAANLGVLAKLIGVDLRRIDFLLELAEKGVSNSAIDEDACREADGVIIDRDRDFMLEFERNLVTLRRIPFFDVKIPASGWLDSGDARTADEADGWTTVPRDVPADAFALRIFGDCMEPEFPSGAVIVFVPVRPGDHGAQFEPGKAYYFEHSDGKATFKKVFYEPPKQRYRLEPVNPKHKPIYVPEQMLGRMSRAVRMVVEIR